MLNYREIHFKQKLESLKDIHNQVRDSFFILLIVYHYQEMQILAITNIVELQWIRFNLDHTLNKTILNSIITKHQSMMKNQFT